MTFSLPLAQRPWAGRDEEMQVQPSVAGGGSGDALGLRPSFCAWVRLSASLCLSFCFPPCPPPLPPGPFWTLSGSAWFSHQVTWGGLLLEVWFRKELEAAAKPTCSWPRAPQPCAHPGHPPTSRPTHAGSPPLTQGVPDRAPESPLEVGLARVRAPLCRPAGD